MRIIYFILICLFVSHGAFAQKELSLENAIAKGLSNNYNIKISDQNIRIAQNNDTWGRAGKYPMVTAGAQLGTNLTEETNQASFLRGEYLNASIAPNVNMSWNLYNGGLVEYQKNQLETLIDLEKTFREVEIQNTVRSIQQNYYLVLFEEARMDVLKEVLKVSQDRFEYENIRKDFGQGNNFSILQFQDALLSDSTSMILQENAIRNARQQFLRALNEDIDPGYYNLTDALSTALEPLDKTEIKNQLIQDNPNLKSLEINKQLAAINSRIVNTRLKPSLTLNSGVTATYSLLQIFGTNPMTGEEYPLIDGETYRWNTSLNLNYNLYNGGVNKINKENALIQQEIAEYDILETTASLMNQVDILFNNYDNQLEQVKLLEKRIQVVSGNLDIAEERLKSGQINSLDYRNIQLNYLNTAFSRIQAIYNLLSIKTDIAFLISGIEE